jgi:hypothetical protein
MDSLIFFFSTAANDHYRLEKEKEIWAIRASICPHRFSTFGSFRQELCLKTMAMTVMKIPSKVFSHSSDTNM